MYTARNDKESENRDTKGVHPNLSEARRSKQPTTLALRILTQFEWAPLGVTANIIIYAPCRK